VPRKIVQNKQSLQIQHVRFIWHVPRTTVRHYIYRYTLTLSLSIPVECWHVHRTAGQPARPPNYRVVITCRRRGVSPPSSATVVPVTRVNRPDMFNVDIGQPPDRRTAQDGEPKQIIADGQIACRQGWAEVVRHCGLVSVRCRLFSSCDRSSFCVVHPQIVLVVINEYISSCYSTSRGVGTWQQGSLIIGKWCIWK
jgi:hypothetical protein